METKKEKIFILRRVDAHYIATINGEVCKILTNQNLMLGPQELDVNDISVRSSFGDDLVYELVPDKKKFDGQCTLMATSNRIMEDRCRMLSGEYDPAARVWTFSNLVADEVKKIDEKYNSELVPIEITFVSDKYNHNLEIRLAGILIVQYHEQFSTGKMCNGAALIVGTTMSDGSRKIAKGSVLRMFIPSGCLDDLDAEKAIIFRRL